MPDPRLAARNQSILLVVGCVVAGYILWSLLGWALKRRPAVQDLREWVMGFVLVFWFALLLGVTQ